MNADVDWRWTFSSGQEEATETSWLSNCLLFKANVAWSGSLFRELESHLQVVHVNKKLRRLFFIPCRGRSFSNLVSDGERQTCLDYEMRQAKFIRQINHNHEQLHSSVTPFTMIYGRLLTVHILVSERRVRSHRIDGIVREIGAGFEKINMIGEKSFSSIMALAALISQSFLCIFAKQINWISRARKQFAARRSKAPK